MVLKFEDSEEAKLVVGDTLLFTEDMGIRGRTVEMGLVEVDQFGKWEPGVIMPGSIFKKLKPTEKGPVEIYYQIKEVCSETT